MLTQWPILHITWWTESLGNSCALSFGVSGKLRSFCLPGLPLWHVWIVWGRGFECLSSDVRVVQRISDLLGMFSLDKRSSFSQRENFNQITVNFVIFLVYTRFCFYWPVPLFRPPFCDRRTHRRLREIFRAGCLTAFVLSVGFTFFLPAS